MTRRNLATSLKRRRRADPMDCYDRLPPDLRLWLSGAKLPWSSCSALKLWNRLAGECAGDPDAIRRRLDRAEARMLARDASRIWGASYPVVSGLGAETG